MKIKTVAIYAAILAALALLLVLVFLMAPSASIDTAEVVLPTTPVQTEEPGEESSSESGTVIDITPETVQSALSVLSRTDSYSRTLTIETAWSGGSVETSVSVQVRGDSARLTITGDGDTKNVLITGDELWIWYAGDESIYHGLATEDAADEYQSLLSYEAVLELEPEQITDAGYTEYRGQQCIYVEYAAGEFGYVHCFWVSVETGLVMGGQVYNEDGLIYSMSSSEPDITTPDESVFTPPDSGSAS